MSAPSAPKDRHASTPGKIYERYDCKPSRHVNHLSIRAISILFHNIQNIPEQTPHQEHTAATPLRREKLRTTPVSRASKLILPGEQDHRRGAS